MICLESNVYQSFGGIFPVIKSPLLCSSLHSPLSPFLTVPLHFSPDCLFPLPLPVLMFILSSRLESLRCPRLMRHQGPTPLSEPAVEHRPCPPCPPGAPSPPSGSLCPQNSWAQHTSLFVSRKVTLPCWLLCIVKQLIACVIL